MRTDLKLLICGLLLLKGSIAMADDSASSALSAINAGLSITASTIGQVGQAQAMSQQVASMAGLANTTSRNTAQSVSATIMNLNAALAAAVAEEQKCEQDATAAIAKSKPVDSLATLLATKVSCTNYDKVEKDGLLWIKELKAIRQKFACIGTMQDSMTAITASFQKPLAQLINADTDAWNTEDKIVKTYDGMAKKLDDSLNGDNGFVAQLAQLKAAVNQLQNVIGGAAGGGSSAVSIGSESFSGNLAQQVKDLGVASSQAANAWLKGPNGIIADAVNNCFMSTPMPCSSGANGGTVNMTPIACMQAEVNGVVGQSSNQGAYNNINSSALMNLIQSQQDALNNSITSTSLSPSDPVGFVKYANSQFSSALSAMDAKFSGLGALNGSAASISQLRSFYDSTMNTCWQRAVNNFTQDINSKGPRYYAGYAQVDAQRSAILSTETQVTSTITSMMNNFVTNFSQTYSPGLPQFSANCSATTDANAGLDCIRELKAQLDAGINGTTAFAQLSTGGSYTASPGPTAINMEQSVVYNSQTSSLQTISNNVTCVGFNDCINKMQVQEKADQGMSKQDAQLRDGFVVSANKTIDAIVGAAASSFGQVSGIIDGAKKSLIASMGALGIGGIDIKKTDISKTPLTKDSTTGLYTMPSDMKGALAANGSYSEIDMSAANSSITDAAKDQADKIAKKMGEASAMEQKYCKVVKKDFDALKAILGTDKCTFPYDKLCASNQEKRFIASMDSILDNGQVYGSSPNDNGDSPSTVKSDLDDCRSQTNSACGGVSNTNSCDSLQTNLSTVKGTAAAVNGNASATQAQKDSANSDVATAQTKLNTCTDSNTAYAKLSCFNKSNASCVAEIPDSFNYQQRTEDMADGASAILSNFSSLMNACTQYPPPPLAKKDSVDQTKDPYKPLSKADCDSGVSTEANNLSCACWALSEAIDKEKAAVPDKMPTGSDASDSGINSSDGFTNPGATKSAK